MCFRSVTYFTLKGRSDKFPANLLILILNKRKFSSFPECSRSLLLIQIGQNPTGGAIRTRSLFEKKMNKGAQTNAPIPFASLNTSLPS